jgi:hypothetical protein
VSIPIKRSVSPVDTTTVSPSTTLVTVTDRPAPGAIELDGEPDSPPALEQPTSTASATASSERVRRRPMTVSLAPASGRAPDVDRTATEGKHQEMQPTGRTVVTMKHEPGLT